jgi:ABC-2 type transport system ATP-binding protein
VIYGTNSKLLGLHLGPVDGTAEFDFEIPQLPLGAGTYTIHGAVADRAGAELHRMREGARFVVAGDGSEVGFLTLGPRLARVDLSDTENPEPRLSLT